MLRRMLVILPLATLLLCASCSTNNMGALWPDMAPPPPPAFTPEEAFALAQFSKDYPEAARKIVGHNNEMSAMLREYHKQMIQHNRDVAKMAGMEQSKIDLIYPKE